MTTANMPFQLETDGKQDGVNTNSADDGVHQQAVCFGVAENSKLTLSTRGPVSPAFTLPPHHDPNSGKRTSAIHGLPKPSQSFPASSRLSVHVLSEDLQHGPRHLRGNSHIDISAMEGNHCSILLDVQSACVSVTLRLLL